MTGCPIFLGEEEKRVLQILIWYLRVLNESQVQVWFRTFLKQKQYWSILQITWRTPPDRQTEAYASTAVKQYTYKQYTQWLNNMPINSSDMLDVPNKVVSN